MQIKTNGRECQEDVDTMARLYYACALSGNDYGIECASFNNFLDYFTERWSNISPPTALKQGEQYPHEWRSFVWQWSKKPEVTRIE